jgi:hypothetical protein
MTDQRTSFLSFGSEAKDSLQMITYKLLVGFLPFLATNRAKPTGCKWGREASLAVAIVSACMRFALRSIRCFVKQHEEHSWGDSSQRFAARDVLGDPGYDEVVKIAQIPRF